MLEAKNIFFKYKNTDQWLLKEFSLKILPGEITGLMGKSGSGKTTLAKILSGYLLAQKGIILYNNKALPDLGYSPVQLIIQHPEMAVNPRWKIKKILSEADGSSPDFEKLDLLQLNRELLERYPHELSGGELQRVTLYRIMNPKTRYIVADEISGMLDAITQANIWSALLSYASRNKTGILAISHDQKLLEKICTCIRKI